MRKLTSAGAAAFAASSLLFGGSPTSATTGGTVHVERAEVRTAEAAFRRAKRTVITNYAVGTSAAQARLRLALAQSETEQERAAAWSRYHEQTAPQRAAAELGLEHAKAEFVARLREISGTEVPEI